MRIPILAYHSISDNPWPGMERFTVTPAHFARHLDLVVAGGFTALTVSDLADRLDRGQAVPRRTVALTFDDGYDDTLTLAAPMLAARRLTATVYVTTGLLRGSPEPGAGPALGRMLGWGHLVELEDAGLEVGAHSHTHPQLDVLARSDAAAEIRNCKRLLEDGLGHTVRTFAYPHGYASRWVRDEVRRSGFRSACGVRNAFSHEEDARWMMARLTVTASATAAQVQAWLDGTGARTAGRGERVRTTAWRGARRARRLSHSLVR